MRKALLALAVAGSISATFGVQAQETPEGYQLEQVLIMSRHNLRAPLANNGSVLEQSTPKQWPEWEVPGGQLTTKGGVLEVYMGPSMREWLAQQIEARGGQVEFVVAYQRGAPRFTAQEVALAQQAARDGSVWLLSSSEAVAHRAEALPGQHWGAAHALATHPRIAEAARAAGFGTVRECRPALEDVVASIESAA